ncbi:MAG: hypothetical protein R3B36_04625 [Polyangiaceae bacterium]
MTKPVVPAPAPPDAPHLFFKRGRRFPRAIAWFGFRSFWGHLWHLLASVIATEDIDSRDWMLADEPEELTRRIARVLRAPRLDAPSLTEALDRDVWIDFVADTGDDISVSEAVARMVTSIYEVDDPSEPGARLELPRGDVLVFGGDTAYPVATDIEIHNRVIVPFNDVLRDLDDGHERVLLGIPGNHDWYAGLDGFGRMFRRRRSTLGRADGPTSKGAQTDRVDRLGQIGHVIEWIEAFRVGRYVVKRAALVLTGYTPVQSASYWALRLGPALDFLGVDRQLRVVDFRQRGFMAERMDPGRGVVLCLADPVHAFLEPNAPGVATLEALDLSLERDGLLVLTGDTHHYCRQEIGTSMHVIAGGGGAFLHPACIARGRLPAPAGEFPGPKATLALVLQVPWQIVHGRSGFIVHAAMALVYLPAFFVQSLTPRSSLLASAITAVVAVLACVGLAGWRQRLVPIASLALLAGVVVGFLPYGVTELLSYAGDRAGLDLSDQTNAMAGYAASIYLGTLALGTYLMLLNIFGLEQHQAMSALAHPGYKHFVRLRVRRDGTGVDGWVLGRVDPLDPKGSVVLVDRFHWRNAKAAAATAEEATREETSREETATAEASASREETATAEDTPTREDATTAP